MIVVLEEQGVRLSHIIWQGAEVRVGDGVALGPEARGATPFENEDSVSTPGVDAPLVIVELVVNIGS